MAIIKKDGPDVNTLPSPKKSRFKVCNPSDPIFPPPTKGKQSIPRLLFNLQSEPVYKTTHDDYEVKVTLPEWIESEINRQIEGTPLSLQDAISICMEKALLRLMAYNGVYGSWDKLRKALTHTNQKWIEDSADWTDFNAMTKKFRINIPSISGSSMGKRKTIRLHGNSLPWDDSIKGFAGQFYAVHNSLGIWYHDLLLVLVIDGIRSQPETVYRDKMDDIVEDFYFHMHRRLRVLYANVRHVWDIDMSNEVQEVMEHIEERGIC